ncbi:5-oxoprolinase subunit B family protein [Salinigranum halophilum]|jgi:urea carboxylase|uniref:5-oxoprolinase subunit B family protein n=1 Tax=Salinigranum halophilum TaxID=2565931 RepID=UPI0010A77053|nr:allophanate hydrolase subunit 1 [Salinigranum halophilum]
MSAERITPTELPEPRYEHGADDYVFVELSEEMSFDANFQAMAITQQIRERDIPGVDEICPANASYLLHFDPDEIAPTALVDELKQIAAETDLSEYEWDARVIDVPVLYQDEWTHETLMRFRDNHQDPDATDLEYSARINGYETVQDFIDAHAGAPHMVTMVGFVPGLPWCFQMVPESRQIEVPKYVQPRTDTPSRAVGFGGAFTAIYPVQGAGGYQLYGRTPVEVLDVDQELADFEESMVLPNPGDILNFRQIDREEYDAIREEVEDGSYRYTMEEVAFSPEEFFADPDGYNERLVEVLY